MPGSKYSFEVDGPEVKGEGKPRRHITLQGKSDLIKNDDPEVTTLFENFQKGVRHAGAKPCLGVRKIDENGEAGEYVWETYNEVYERILNVGSAMKHLGLEHQTNVGLYSINRPEWIIAEQGCHSQGFCTVPLYDTLGAEAVEYIMNQTEMPLIFLTADKMGNVLSQSEKLKNLKHLVVMDKVTTELSEEAAKRNVQLYSFTDFEKLGKEHRIEPRPSTPEDLATICYTSGTTGLPKGVMLTHENMIAVAAAGLFLGKKGHSLEFEGSDVHLSYLPLAHSFERCLNVYVFGLGAPVGFYQGDVKKLLDDIAVLKPTFFPSVPRLLNRIYDKVLAGVEAKGGVSKFLFDTAFGAKRAALKDGYLTHWLWDRLVFSKVKARLGGRVRFMISGSAPLSVDVMDFLRVCFACEVSEGYGQTENGAGATLTSTGDYDAGTVGPPLPCNEIKLVDVPEMDYTSKDEPYPRGEVCLKGYNIMKGYYRNEEKTKEAIDDDGWLHTGDIGLWDEKGRLKIVDRKKNIFKLSQGEYIAPEKIENVFAKCPLVAQSFVYGDSLQHQLVAIVVPDEETFVPMANSRKKDGSFEELVKDPELEEIVLKEMTTMARSSGLKGFEIVKKIVMVSEVFSVDNELLTPTFKLKRPQAKKRFQAEIDNMYAALNEAEKK